MIRYIVLIASLLMFSCSSLGIEELNRPSKTYSVIKQNRELKLLENQGWDNDVINLSKEDSEFTTERRLSTRQRIIDSLQIPLNKLMIIDYFSHGTAGAFEINYFIYDSSFISYSYSASRTPKEKFSSGKVKDLKEKNSHERMLSEIYEAFNINYPNIPKDFKREDDGKTSYSYEVTIPKDNKVNFYKISNYENFIVYKLKGKKLR